MAPENSENNGNGNIKKSDDRIKNNVEVEAKK